MTVGPLAICLACKHLRSADTCAAYPDGIPRKILFEHWDHRLPYPGDRGMRFELARGKGHLLDGFEEVEKLLEELGSPRP